jgi:hypothetical protein
VLVKEEPCLKGQEMPMIGQKPGAKVPNCERCGRPMILKFTTLRLSEPGRMLIYQCLDCEKLAFLPAPAVR